MNPESFSCMTAKASSSFQLPLFFLDPFLAYFYGVPSHPDALRNPLFVFLSKLSSVPLLLSSAAWLPFAVTRPIQWLPPILSSCPRAAHLRGSQKTTKNNNNKNKKAKAPQGGLHHYLELFLKTITKQTLKFDSLQHNFSFKKMNLDESFEYGNFGFCRFFRDN